MKHCIVKMYLYFYIVGLKSALDPDILYILKVRWSGYDMEKFTRNGLSSLKGENSSKLTVFVPGGFHIVTVASPIFFSLCPRAFASAANNIKMALIKSTVRGGFEPETFRCTKARCRRVNRHKEQDIKCSEVILTIGKYEVSRVDLRGSVINCIK